MSTKPAASSAVYHVSVEPARHEIAVELHLSGPAAEGTIRVEVPTWVPGDYEFMTFGRDIFDVRAVLPGTDAPLAVRREGWQAYQIEGGTGDVILRYRASCSSTDLGEPCGILDDQNGVLLGTRYLFTPAHRGACRVTYAVPAGWEIHHPSGAKRIDATTWEYPSYEILLDTPVVMGTFDRITRCVRGTDFHHVFLTRGVGFSSQVGPFVDDLVKVAEVYHDIFGSFPFADYTYVLSLNPTADWGLEHLTSTMIGLGPDVFTDPDQRAIGVRVCAHELFHAWNVRRLRPATLGHLDFEHGSFTEGLWVAEGFTRYYEFLSCTRTGVYSPDQFFSSVVNYYRHLASLPAYLRVTAVDSSAATFLNHQKYPGRVNDAIDYYDKGMVIAFDLDAALRTDVQEGSLDQSFRAFYETFVGVGAGYTIADFVGFFERVHPGLGAQITREAEGRAGLSIVEKLQRLGFRVEEESVPYAGIVLQDDTGPGIYGVLDTSPAGATGLAAEDVIVTVEGYPFSFTALKWTIAHQGAVTLGVLRGNQPRTYTIQIGQRTQIGKLTWTGTAEQALRIAAWLGQPFEPAHGQGFPLDFYENFHGIETVL
jgi:predicted metalloprotease with PDZ domain